MLRHRILLCVLGVVVLAVLPAAAPGQTLQREPTLRERLVTGLQVRRPSEFAYIDAVIDTVDRGDLPEKLVDRVFFYSRSKAPQRKSSRRGIVYFQPALDRIAADLRITIAPDPENTPAGG